MSLQLDPTHDDDVEPLKRLEVDEEELTQTEDDQIETDRRNRDENFIVLDRKLGNRKGRRET